MKFSTHFNVLFDKIRILSFEIFAFHIYASVTFPLYLHSDFHFYQSIYEKHAIFSYVVHKIKARNTFCVLINGYPLNLYDSYFCYIIWAISVFASQISMQNGWYVYSRKNWIFLAIRTIFILDQIYSVSSHISIINLDYGYQLFLCRVDNIMHWTWSYKISYH